MNIPGGFSAGVARDRIVAVVAELQDGREQVGSGFLIDGSLVLTVKHCTHDMLTGEPPRNVRVIRGSDGLSTDQIEVMSSQELDVALLELINPPWDVELERPNLARIDRRLSGILRDCTSMGYPLYQYDSGSHDRRTAELHGVIYQTDEAESGRLLLREPLLDGVSAPGAFSDEAPGNPWGGLSGAVVFYRLCYRHYRRAPPSTRIHSCSTNYVRPTRGILCHGSRNPKDRDTAWRNIS